MRPQLVSRSSIQRQLSVFALLQSGWAQVVAAVLIALVGASTAIAANVVVGRDRIVVRKAIPFAPGSDKIPKSGESLLKELAKALNENSQFTKVRIEGHTDSSGNAENNRKLSQRRADAVREALIRHGVGGDRLSAKGFGATDPLRSNATSSGRRVNRRVVFEVLQVGGKKVERPPLAKVSERRNAVAARAPLEKDWRNATVGDGLRRSWRVRTEEDSGAGITFRDASRIEMREETLVIIFGATESKSRVKPMRAAMETGALTAWLQNEKGENAGLVVETPSGDAELEGGRATVRIGGTDRNRASAFSNHSGKPARVYGKKKSGKRMSGSTSVKKGYGSRVKAGKRPEKPRKLPAPPRVVVNQPVVIGTAGMGAAIDGGWLPASPPKKPFSLVTIEVRSDREGEAPTRVTVDGGTSTFRLEKLPPGKYALRASVVDDIGLESGLSEPLVVTVLQLVRAAPTEEAQKVATFAPGDALVAPSGFECAVDAISFDSPTALIVRPTTKSVRCRPAKTDESAAGQTETTVAIAVANTAGFSVDAPKLAVGKASELILRSRSPFSSADSVVISGGEIREQDTSMDAKGKRRVVLRVLPGVETVSVSITRRGIPLQSFSLAVERDLVAPTVSDVTVARLPEDQRKIRVTAKVVDESSEVSTVSAQVVGADSSDRVSMSRGETKSTFTVVMPAPGPDAEQTIEVSAIDSALNGPTVVTQSVPPAVAGTSFLWLAIPVAIAIPVFLGGAGLALDGGFYESTGGPYVGRLVDQALTPTNPDPDVAAVELWTGVGVMTVAVLGAAAATAVYIGLLAAEGAESAEE